MSTCSVAKGCFVFKPSCKKRRVSQSTGSFGEINNDSEDAKLRFVTCQSLWNQIKSETEQIQEDLNKKLFDNLVSFLSRAHSGFQEKTTEWTCRMKSREIPTAALVLGVNVTDHDLTFKSLSEVLHNDITPYVALLEAKDCPGIKNLIQKLMGQLINCYIDVDSVEDEDYVQVSQTKIRCSMTSLVNWYKSVTKKTDSETPSKKRTSSSRHCESPPVVVIFKDLESFTTKVLQDFIVISSQHIHELPLVLIFGIATSPMIIHSLLPHSVSSLLCIELFQSLSCKEHLSTIIDKLLLTDQFPFKLGGKVLQVLINIFLYHDFSVQNFIKGYQALKDLLDPNFAVTKLDVKMLETFGICEQLCTVEHFYSQPLSVLCCQLVDAKPRVHSLSSEQCENIRRLPSFRRYVESQESEKQIALLTEDSFLKETTLKLLEDLHFYHEKYVSVLRCLHVFTSFLPKHPLGKQIRELHCACLENQVWETEEYESSLQLARMLNKADLVTLLQQCVEIFVSSPGKEFDKTVEKLNEFLTQFQKLEVAEALQEQDGDVSSQKELQKKTDLYHLQKTLLELKESRRSKKLTKFEMLRLEVVDYIDSLSCVILLGLLLLYDVFFVFITPFITKNGASIMVEVAAGPFGNSEKNDGNLVEVPTERSAPHEKLPVVIRVPRLEHSAATLCDMPFSLLGFGDIIVPGLLVAYCRRFDVQTRSSSVYYISCTIAYAIGMVLTFVVLALMKMGQPALLYLVPCTLITSSLVAWRRKEMKKFWKGNSYQMMEHLDYTGNEESPASASDQPGGQ